MNEQIKKFIVIFCILVFSIVADLWTKSIAENHLASPRYADHQIEVVVPDNMPEDATVETLMATHFTRSSEADRKQMAQFVTDKSGQRVSSQSPVHSGDVLEFGLVSTTVIDGFWTHIYARNPGAAFSFLANASDGFRQMFFRIMSIVAFLVMGAFLVISKWKNQKGMIIPLSFILGGAIANFVDRLRFDYVIDFISWQLTKTYYWPTFNLADVFITVGVGFLFIDLMRNAWKDSKAKKAAVSEDDEENSENSDESEEKSEKEEKLSAKDEEEDKKTEEDEEKSKAGKAKDSEEGVNVPEEEPQAA